MVRQPQQTVQVWTSDVPDVTGYTILAIRARSSPDGTRSLDVKCSSRTLTLRKRPPGFAIIEREGHEVILNRLTSILDEGPRRG